MTVLKAIRFQPDACALIIIDMQRDFCSAQGYAAQAGIDIPGQGVAAHPVGDGDVQPVPGGKQTGRDCDGCDPQFRLVMSRRARRIEVPVRADRQACLVGSPHMLHPSAVVSSTADRKSVV